MKTPNLLNYIILISTIFLFTSCNHYTKLEEELAEIHKELKLIRNYQQLSEKRFQIYQSTIAARGTYKLDSFEGRVYQMVVDSIDNNLWQELSIYGHTNNNTEYTDRSNYILFLSTLQMRDTYLLNVNTGATWQLFRDIETGENFFGAIE